MPIRTTAASDPQEAAPSVRLLSIEEFRARRRQGLDASPDAKAVGVFRPSIGAWKAHDPQRRSYRFCFSDSGEDRMTDTIDAKGWRLENFLRAPTALFAYDSSAPPIGRAANVAVEDTRLMGDIEFAPREIYEFADTIYKLVGGKFLDAVSVGFLPLEHEWANDDGREWGIDFKVQELLEISVVPVPANPRALIEARAKGIDTRPMVAWAEKLLDGGGKVIVPRAELNRLRIAAKEPPMPAPRTLPPRRRAPQADTTQRAEGMSEGDPSSGGAIVGNCGRPADKECGMKDPAECAIHGFSGAGVGDPADNEDKGFRSAVRLAVRAEMQRLARGAIRPRLRADAPDGGSDAAGSSDLPEGHTAALRTASMHFKSAQNYYDAGDEHHDEGLNLMADAVKDLDAEGGAPADHEETVRSAHAHFKSADALYDLGDDHHDKAMQALDDAVKALDADPPPSGTEQRPETDKTPAAILVRAARYRASVPAA